MNIILWGIFYIITTLLLIFFFFREKQVIDYIRNKEDQLLQKINLTADSNKIGSILTVVGLILGVVFFFLVDKTPDRTIVIKNYGIYGLFLINLAILLYRKEHEWMFLTNLIMLILGKLMFNILDSTFYIYLALNVILSAFLIYFYRKETDEVITKATISEENKKNSKNKYDIQVITDEIVEVEKRKKSSLGKALYRIDTALTAIILVGLIQIFYIGNYVIPSGSMEPTILIKDRVFANMVKYRFTSPKVGEIIAFKEPLNDQVMYTKRITGGPGDTMQIVSGRMVINDKPSEILNREYEPEGLFYDNKIYVPKKGDKVKLDKIIMFGKLAGYTKEKIFVTQPDWQGYYNKDMYQELTATEFLARINQNKGFSNIIANNDDFDENSNLYNVYYTFTLKVEGRNELVLPIMDLKNNDEVFLKLLNGEEITLNQNYYMAMGDNTRNSFDSRYFGYVAENRIKGELLLRWWPLNRIGLL